MDEGTKGRVSELLSETSRLLSSSSSSTASNPAVNLSRSAIPQATISETLRRAQGMLRESTSTGLCRRLNRQERLRVASGPCQRNSQTPKTVCFPYGVFLGAFF